MSTFVEQNTNPSIKIETSMCVNTGYFGTALLEYGACHIGKEIWIKHGLTEEDKEAFETYQNGCEELIDVSIDDPIWFTPKIQDLVAYERATSSEKRAKIVEIIMEVDACYEIGNWKSCVFEERELGLGLRLDSDEIDNPPACLLAKDEQYIEWRKIKMSQLLVEESWAAAEAEEQELKDWYENERTHALGRDEDEDDEEQELAQYMGEEEVVEEEVVEEEVVAMEFDEEAWNAAKQEEEDLEDWYERQREMRYADAIENLRDQMHDC